MNDNVPFAAVDLDRSEDRVQDPVLTYPMPAVKLALDLSIPFTTALARGNDLCNQVRSLDQSAIRYDSFTPGQDNDQVWV